MAKRSATTDLSGEYEIHRTAELEIFNLRDIAAANKALNEFLAKFTDPGWLFKWEFNPPGDTLFVLASFDELVQVGNAKPIMGGNNAAR